MTFRSHFRDKQEWLKSTCGGINLNTSSDEAAKEYDACLSQLCGWYEDPNLGGLDGCVRRMLAADGEFVLGRAFELELSLMGGLNAPRLDASLARKLDNFNKLIERKSAAAQLSDQERQHARVVNLWASSELKQAARALDELVVACPEDLSAVKMAQDTHFFLGQSEAMSNTVAICLSKTTRNRPSSAPVNPLLGYVHGMMAFAMEESGAYAQAREQALKALELNPRDTWAIHNYAHCLEMQAKCGEGLKWMVDKQADWEPCQTLACHQYWHTALFHINNNHFDEAVALLDNEVLTRCVQNCSSLDMHDAASMVYRMELVDLFGKTSGASANANTNAKASADGDASESSSASRWSSIFKICEPHKRDHLIGFNDAHYMMSYLGSANLETARELIESIDEVPSLNEGQTVVKPLLEAMYQFKLKAYDRCVDLLEPIRNDIIKIGGSHAQRDVFAQLLLVAAIRSDKQQHNILAEKLLAERVVHQGGRRLPQTELLAKAA